MTSLDLAQYYAECGVGEAGAAALAAALRTEACKLTSLKMTRKTKT